MIQTRSAFFLAALAAASTSVAQTDERWFVDLAACPAAAQAGGLGVDPATGTVVLLRHDATTWGWNGTALQQLAAAGGPAARARAMIAAVDVPGFQGVLCFGGSAGGQPSDETWLWSSTGQSWQQLAPQSAPEPRPGHDGGGAAFSVITGGGGDSGVWILPDMAPMHTFEPLGGGGCTWTPAAAGPLQPPLRAGASGCGTTDGRILVTGGTGPGATGPGGAFDDAWIYVVATQTWSQVPGTAPAVVGGAMAYDPVRDVAVLVDVQQTPHATWHFDFSSQTWSLATPAVALQPSPASGRGYAAWHPLRAEVVFVDELHALSVLSTAAAAIAFVQPESCAKVLGIALSAPAAGGPRVSLGGYSVDVAGAAPGNALLFALGDQLLTPPAPIGPGCAAFFGDVWENWFVLPAPDPATFVIALPNDPAFIGVAIEHQAVELDQISGAVVGVTDDLRARVGR